MFSEAVESLSSSCVPAFFQDYKSSAAAVALFGLFLTQAIQIFANAALENTDWVDVISDVDLDITIEKDKIENGKQLTHLHVHEEHIRVHHMEIHQEHEEHGHHHALLLKSNRIGVYMLELGIASHSIIIGIALGTSYSDFRILLGAICLHKFFEGVAVSSVVLEAEFEKKGLAMMMVLMCMFFYCKNLTCRLDHDTLGNRNWNRTEECISSISKHGSFSTRIIRCTRSWDPHL